MEGLAKTGAEIRRLHIIYFLSRKGLIEHPHLIRVHHLNRNGVYLRDVKRWMSDLRGKDMAEAFSWSYKRRYKNGYVWQDLLDDDLITPICDNEYVLKGSEILPATVPKSEANAYGEMKAIEDKDEEQSSKNEANHTSPAKTSSEVYQESPIFSSEKSTLTEEDSMQRELISPSKYNSEEEQMDKFESFSSSSSYSDLLSQKKEYKKKEKGNNGNKGNEEKPSSEFCLLNSSPQSQFAKRKSNSNGASKILRHLITCGAVDTNDSALVYVDKSSKNMPSSKEDISSHICKREVIGGSARVFGNHWNQHQQQQYNSARKCFDGVEGSKQQQKTRFGNPNWVPAAYKPVGAPTCSQCGKSFKPEKLHTHMKSCKGLKASAKTATASVKKRPSPATPSSNAMNQLLAISQV